MLNAQEPDSDHVSCHTLFWDVEPILLMMGNHLCQPFLFWPYPQQFENAHDYRTNLLVILLN